MIEMVNSVWKYKNFIRHKSFSSSFFILLRGLKISLKADRFLLIGDIENPQNQNQEIVIKSFGSSINYWDLTLSI